MLESIQFPITPDVEASLRAEFERALSTLRAIEKNSSNIPAGHVATLTQSCPKSPIKFCVYDPDGDMSYDECIYCGEPEERK